MSSLIAICAGFLVLLWCMCGVYAQSIARRRLLPEVLSFPQALLQGPFWLKRALIWSTATLPPALLGDTPSVLQQEEIDSSPQAKLSTDKPSSKYHPGGEAKEAGQSTPALQRPKKLPRRPVRGTVKTLCPYCESKNKHDRDAHCIKCGKLNPWLKEEWLLEVETAEPQANTPAQAVHEPQAVEEAEIISSEPLATQAPPPREYDDTLALEEGQELEAFDALPKRPRVGTVRTVCPDCHKKSKHDRDGVCKKCHQPNNWLRKRWGLLDVGVELKFQPPPTEVYEEQVAELSDPSGMELIPHAPKILEHCPQCSRRAFPDYHGNCAFCGASLQENNHG